ncbi:MAG: hypothetical protein QE277_10295 [Flectobacillus sp.]|nr:hypothetical protein [Flectobacillus sp.]
MKTLLMTFSLVFFTHSLTYSAELVFGKCLSVDSILVPQAMSDSLLLDLSNRRITDFQVYIQQVADKSLAERLRKKSMALAISIVDKYRLTKANKLKKRRIPRITLLTTSGKTKQLTLTHYLKRLYEGISQPSVKVVRYEVFYYANTIVNEKGSNCTFLYGGKIEGSSFKHIAKRCIKRTITVNATSDILLYLGELTLLESPNTN